MHCRACGVKIISLFSIADKRTTMHLCTKFLHAECSPTVRQTIQRVFIFHYGASLVFGVFLHTRVCSSTQLILGFFFFFKPFPSVSNFQAQCKCSYTWKTCVWICTTFHVFLQSLVYPYNVYPFLLQNQWSKMLESDIIQFVESF